MQRSPTRDDFLGAYRLHLFIRHRLVLHLLHQAVAEETEQQNRWHVPNRRDVMEFTKFFLPHAAPLHISNRCA